MVIVLVKDGKKVEAFYRPKGSGYMEIDYDSPLALPYKMKA